MLTKIQVVAIQIRQTDAPAILTEAKETNE